MWRRPLQAEAWFSRLFPGIKPPHFQSQVLSGLIFPGQVPKPWSPIWSPDPVFFRKNLCACGVVGPGQTTSPPLHPVVTL